MRRAALILLAAAGLSLAACSSGSKKPLVGTVTLGSGDFSKTPAHVTAGTPQSCNGQDGYDDIVVGSNVTVSDQAGTVIATGVVGPGKVDGFHCVFTFAVPSVPSKPFYKVAVGHRNGVTFSADDVKAGNVGLSLDV